LNPDENRYPDFSKNSSGLYPDLFGLYPDLFELYPDLFGLYPDEIIRIETDIRIGLI